MKEESKRPDSGRGAGPAPKIKADECLRMSGTGHRLQVTPCGRCGHVYESINTWVCGKHHKPLTEKSQPCESLTSERQELKWKKLSPKAAAKSK